MKFDDVVNELAAMLEDNESQDNIDRFVKAIPEALRDKVVRAAKERFEDWQKGIPLEGESDD